MHKIRSTEPINLYSDQLYSQFAWRWSVGYALGQVKTLVGGYITAEVLSHIGLRPLASIALVSTAGLLIAAATDVVTGRPGQALKADFNAVMQDMFAVPANAAAPITTNEKQLEEFRRAAYAAGNSESIAPHAIRNTLLWARHKVVPTQEL